MRGAGVFLFPRRPLAATRAGARRPPAVVDAFLRAPANHSTNIHPDAPPALSDGAVDALVNATARDAAFYAFVEGRFRAQVAACGSPRTRAVYATVAPAPTFLEARRAAFRGGIR